MIALINFILICFAGIGSGGVIALVSFLLKGEKAKEMLFLPVGGTAILIAFLMPTPSPLWLTAVGTSVIGWIIVMRYMLSRSKIQPKYKNDEKPKRKRSHQLDTHYGPLLIVDEGGDGSGDPDWVSETKSKYSGTGTSD